MRESLRACPFCRHEAIVEHNDEEAKRLDAEDYYMSVCTWCSGISGWYASPDEAAKAWNSRV